MDYSEEEGKRGEDLVYDKVIAHLNLLGFEYRISRNVIMPYDSVFGKTSKSTTEFDLVVFTPYEIFLVEVKNEYYKTYNYGEDHWEIHVDDEDVPVSNPIKQNHRHKEKLCGMFNLLPENVITVEILLKNGKDDNQTTQYPNDYIFNQEDLEERLLFLLATDTTELIKDYDQYYRELEQIKKKSSTSEEDHKKELKRIEKIESIIKKQKGYYFKRTDIVMCDKCNGGKLCFRDYLPDKTSGQKRSRRYYFLGCTNYYDPIIHCKNRVDISESKRLISPNQIIHQKELGEEKVVKTVLDIFDELEENYEWEKKNRRWYEDNCKQLQREKKELEKQLDEITRERIELKNEIEKFRKLIGRLYYFKDNS